MNVSGVGTASQSVHITASLCLTDKTGPSSHLKPQAHTHSTNTVLSLLKARCLFEQFLAALTPVPLGVPKLWTTLFPRSMSQIVQ